LGTLGSAVMSSNSISMGIMQPLNHPTQGHHFPLPVLPVQHAQRSLPAPWLSAHRPTPYSAVSPKYPDLQQHPGMSVHPSGFPNCSKLACTPLSTCSTAHAVSHCDMLMWIALSANMATVPHSAVCATADITGLTCCAELRAARISCARCKCGMRHPMRPLVLVVH